MGNRDRLRHSLLDLARKAHVEAQKLTGPRLPADNHARLHTHMCLHSTVIFRAPALAARVQIHADDLRLETTSSFPSLLFFPNPHEAPKM